MHTSAWSPQRLPSLRKNLHGVLGELEKHEDVLGDTKLGDCGSVEVEIRNGEMGVKYVKDGAVGWIPVVRKRRKKSARSEESKSSGNLNVNDKEEAW